MDDIGWSGRGHLSSFIYVDDAIWVKNAFGSRLTGSVEAWEWACERILNGGSFNDIKPKLEGEWRTQAMILGFTVDAETNWISAPGPKITAARNLILSDEFMPGNNQIRLKTMQKLRGPCQHWLIASSFWEITLQTVDSLFGFSDERGESVRFGNQEIRRSFSSMMNLMRDLSRRGSIFAKLFGGYGELDLDSQKMGHVASSVRMSPG